MDQIDNGKITQATSLRLSSLTYTNTLTTFDESNKTIRFDIAPYDRSIATPLEVSLEMPVDVRYTLATLVFLLNVKVANHPQIDGKDIKDFIKFNAHADQGVLELVMKGCWGVTLYASERLGITKTLAHLNPLIVADISTPASEIEPSEFTCYGDSLLQLAPTDIIHVENTMFRGRDMLSNLKRRSESIVHTLGVQSFFGSITPYMNTTGSPVSLQPSEITSFSVSLLDRDLNEIPFRQPWTAVFELTY
tara:strand:+ start:168 stop:914 length:747 start_codon:yes stop_codon:yes gene_type:complete